jgi:hypothetical protein
MAFSSLSFTSFYFLKHETTRPRKKSSGPFNFGIQIRTLPGFLLQNLFGVCLQNTPKLIPDIYAVAGHKVCGEIVLPEEIKRKRLVAPDQIELNVVAEFSMKTRRCSVLPLLYAKTELFDPQKHKDFSDFTTFGFLVLQEKEGKYKPAVLADGKPEILDASDAPEQYRELMGYAMHPHESVGRTFASMLTVRRDSWPVQTQALHKALYRTAK